MRIDVDTQIIAAEKPLMAHVPASRRRSCR